MAKKKKKKVESVSEKQEIRQEADVLPEKEEPSEEVAVLPEKTEGQEEEKKAEKAAAGDEGFFAKYGPNIALGVFILYVILLAIGTAADIFKIQSILDWWIWRTW